MNFLTRQDVVDATEEIWRSNSPTWQGPCTVTVELSGGVKMHGPYTRPATPGTYFIGARYRKCRPLPTLRGIYEVTATIHEALTEGLLFAVRGGRGWFVARFYDFYRLEPEAPK